VARDASKMYASNVTSLIEHLWRQDAASFDLDAADEITSSVLLTHNGRIRHEEVRERAGRE
jgi:NAD/NADP transhydrogenase alpha subunit